MRLFAAAVSMVLGAAVCADVPKVVTDIAPVHSIVSMVMENVGEPVLIVPPGASPHDHSLRPSKARALDQADIVIWMGGTLTPWLDASLEALASDSFQVVLLEQPETELLAVRTGGSSGFGKGEHVGGSDADHDHGTGGGIDPHAWLDPVNASAWAALVAEVLASQDGEHAQEYRSNAILFQERMTRLTATIDGLMKPVRERPFVVYHDAYHYFEHRFGLEAIGAVTEADAVDASPARLAGLRVNAERQGAVCALTEPQFNPGLMTALGAVKLSEIDPIGATLEPGPDLYRDLLLNMAVALSECLKY